MKEIVRQQIIGQKIAKVTYFELNDLDQAFYFENFDNFDLGIELEFSNGFRWHIGWKENDYHEAGEGQYNPVDHLFPHKQVDATNRWKSYLNSTIVDFELTDVNKAWKIPAKCTITFNNSETISIQLAGELTPDGFLPQPLKFVEGGEIYVSFGRKLPPTELIGIIQNPKTSKRKKRDRYFDRSPHPDSFPKVKSPNLIALFILFVVVVLIIIKQTLNN